MKEECQCKQDACNCEQDACHCEQEDCNCENKEKSIDTTCNDKKKKKDNKVEKKLQEMEDKNQELQNELLKSKADFVNYRKRLDDEKSKMLKFCNEDLIKEMLPVLDNFERAIKMDDNDLDDEVSKFLSGFKMIYCHFVNILKDNGVIEIDGNNKPFDPVYHEAIMVEKQEEIASGMVLEVLQKGYILKGKVIRPACVKVSE